MRTGEAPALRTGEFVALAALLMALVALAIDAMLPALAAIGGEFGVSRPNDVQLVVTSLFLGLGAGQLFYGPLSDRIGRRPAIASGLGVFMAGCLLSILAPDFEWMLAGRVLQGVGAAAPRIVTLAMVRDEYEGRRMARVLSFVMAVFILIPALAPVLGQGILHFAGWRAIFTAFFLVAAALLLWFLLRQRETLAPAHRRPFSPRAIGRGVRETLGTRRAVAYALATGFILAPLLAYLASAQRVFEETYRMGALFPLYLGVLSLPIGAAALWNGRLVMRFGMRRLSRLAAGGIVSVSLLALLGLLPFDGLPPLGLYTAYLVVVFVGYGLLFGNLNALAMEPLGHICGVGAAVVASLSNFVAAPLAALVGQSFHGTLYLQIGVFGVLGAAVLLAMWWAERGTARPAG